MERIVWSDEFLVGVETLDNQHRRIVGMINKLIDNPLVATDSETLSDLLTEMTRYASAHFATEEAFLEKYGYPGLAEQKEQHRAFRRKTVQLCSATMVGVAEVPQALLNYLREWWVHHILQDDMTYKAFMATKLNSAHGERRRQLHPAKSLPAA